MMTTDSKIIQLMRPGALGDLLMCTALFPALKAQGYRIRFVVHPEYADILKHHPDIDELVLSTAGTRKALVAETAHLPKAEKYIYLYYPFYGKRDLPAHPIPMHLTTYFCEQAGVPGSDRLSIGLTDEHLEWGEQCQGKILIHTHARWSPYKNWPLDRWAQLVEKLRNELQVEVFQLGNATEPPIRGASRLESPSILHAIAALRYSKLFIGLDSVFNHASRALEKPSIIIWGSTHPFGMGYRQNLNLVNGVAWQPEMGLYGPALQCQPCYREYPNLENDQSKRACPYTVPYSYQALPKNLHSKRVINACMATTAVETVFHHAEQMLEKRDYVKTLDPKPHIHNC